MLKCYFGVLEKCYNLYSEYNEKKCNKNCGLYNKCHICETVSEYECNHCERNEVKACE